MKKYLLFIVIVLLFYSYGCDFLNSEKYSNDNLQSTNSISEDELFVIDQNETYYKSKDLILWAEINGLFTSLNYFTLDSENKDLRIYDNIYLYKDDYFYMLSNDNKDWFAGLNANVSDELVKKELAEGEDYSIIVQKDGIYKIMFNIQTKQFDIEYKNQIDFPKYLSIRNCEVCQFIDNKPVYTPMVINPNNNDELMLSNYTLTLDKALYFFSISHTSNYKINISNESVNIIAYANKKRQGVKSLISANVNIYLNTKTYEIRVEIIGEN